MANEKRLIDANDIKYHEHTECMGHGDFETVRAVTDKEINEMPVVDAGEVVRCENCERRDRNDVDEESGVVWCWKLCRYMKRYGFCSYGVRRSE